MNHFGTLPDGREVKSFTLSAHGLTATILDLGCILQNVRLKVVPHSLTVGSESLDDYVNELKYHGAIAGPVANRISNGSFAIGGTQYQLEKNLKNLHTLHSGSAGVHDKIWSVREHLPDAITLSHDLPEGEGGFPGNRSMTARFSILQGATLRLELTTTSDKPSIANATNHSYWNLDGSGHMRDHTVQLTADEYLPADALALVTGDIATVENTPFDLRTPTRLVSGEPPLDNTFCVGRGQRPLTKRLTLRGASGVTMDVATTEPGVHLYDGRPTYDGLAIECQGWPDAPNKPGFPSIQIGPGNPATQVTEWRFSRT